MAPDPPGEDDVTAPAGGDAETDGERERERERAAREAARDQRARTIWLRIAEALAREP